MIGVIGLGNMGHAIATRLIAEGETVIVWNRTPGKADGLNGAELATTPEDVIQAADVSLCVLANDEATEAVYFSNNGILSADLTGKLVVDLCTMAPERALVLEAAVVDKQGQFLECPVGGTIGPALQGQLLGLAGGSEEAFSSAKPVLEKLTRRLEHFGPVGSGAAMKLAVNLPLMVYWSALGEALGMALAHKVDLPLALDVLSDSSGAIGVAKKRVPAIRELLVHGEQGATNFSLEHAIKDMELMVATASAQGIDADVIAMALARSKEAQQQGFAGLDCSLVAGYHNQQT